MYAMAAFYFLHQKLGDSWYSVILCSVYPRPLGKIVNKYYGILTPSFSFWQL